MLGGFVPLDAIDSEPRLSGFVRRLERMGRVVLFNRRGIGLSDSVPLSDPPTIEDWVDDVIAVLDAAGIESACVIAGLGDIKVAIAAAARVPHRIEQLISINGAIRPLATVLGIGRPEIDQLFNESLRPGRGEIDAFDQLSWAAPSLKDDVAFRSWWDAAGRRGASPSTARVLLAIIGNADVTAECESLECPILVIQRRDAAAFGVAAAEYFVAHSRRGRLRLLAGDDLLCWVDAEGVLGEIEEALTGARSAPESERAVMTMLFTDIVGSTARLADVGDREWRAAIEVHDELSEQVVTRYSGSVINTTGDGILARFSSPSHALRAAFALLDEMRASGLDLRAGLHSAEVDLGSHGVSGIGVHLAARVAALANAHQVVVSRTVADLLLGADLSFESIGEHTLKGVPGSWELFSVDGTSH